MRFLTNFTVFLFLFSTSFSQEVEQVTFFDSGKMDKHHTNLLSSDHGVVFSSYTRFPYRNTSISQYSLSIYQGDSAVQLLSANFVSLRAIVGSHALVYYNYQEDTAHSLGWVNLLTGKLTTIESTLDWVSWNVFGDYDAHDQGVVLSVTNYKQSAVLYIEEGKSTPTSIHPFSIDYSIADIALNSKILGIAALHQTTKNYHLFKADLAPSSPLDSIGAVNASGITLLAGETRLFGADRNSLNHVNIWYVDPQSSVHMPIELSQTDRYSPEFWLARNDTLYYEYHDPNDSIYIRRFHQQIDNLMTLDRGENHYEPNFQANNKQVFYSRKVSGKYTTWMLQPGNIRHVVINYRANDMAVEEVGPIYFNTPQLRLYDMDQDKVLDYSFDYYRYPITASYQGHFYWTSNSGNIQMYTPMQDWDPATRQFENISERMLSEPNSQLAHLVEHGGKLYYSALSGGAGLEPWVSSDVGNESLLKDILAGAEGSEPSRFISTQNGVFFRANDGTGHQLFQIEGNSLKQITTDWGRSGWGYQSSYLTGGDYGPYTWFISPKQEPCKWNPISRTVECRSELNYCRSIGNFYNQTIIHRAFQNEEGAYDHFLYLDGAGQQSKTSYPNHSFGYSGGMTWNSRYFYISASEKEGPEIWTFSPNKGSEFFQELIPGNNLRFDTDPMGGPPYEYYIYPRLLGSNAFGLFAAGDQDLWVLKRNKNSFELISDDVPQGINQYEWIVTESMVYVFHHDTLYAYNPVAESWNRIGLPTYFDYADGIVDIRGSQILFSFNKGSRLWISDGTPDNTQEWLNLRDHDMQIDRHQGEWIGKYLYFVGFKPKVGMQIYRTQPPVLNTSSTEVLQEPLQIYPNPTSRYLHVLGAPRDETVDLVFYDLMGKPVYEISTSGDGFIDTEILQNGWYIVRYELNGQSYTEKIQILK